MTAVSPVSGRNDAAHMVAPTVDISVYEQHACFSLRSEKTNQADYSCDV